MPHCYNTHAYLLKTYHRDRIKVECLYSRIISMRMRTCKTIPQGQEAYEVQMGLFFPGAVVGEGLSVLSRLISSFQYCFNVEGYANTHVH